MPINNFHVFLFKFLEFWYLNYLLLLPGRRTSIEIFSRGAFNGWGCGCCDRGREDVICRGVLVRRSCTGELSAFDSVLESGRNMSSKQIFIKKTSNLSKYYPHKPRDDLIGIRYVGAFENSFVGLTLVSDSESPDCV